MMTIQIRRTFYIFVFSIFTLSAVGFVLPVSALAQGGGVEINMDVLDNYRPPPMFDDMRPPLFEPLSAKPAKEIISIQENYWVPPKPQKKPYFKKKVRSVAVIAPVVKSKPKDIMEDGLLQEDLVSPTARDILRQISPMSNEPEKFAPVAPSEDMLADVAAIQADIESERTNVIETVQSTPLKVDYSRYVTLEFLPGVSVISEDVKLILVEDILVKATRETGSYIEIQSFASNVNDSSSGARRMSLSRGLAVRDFLIEHSISPERINVRPLGDKTDTTPTDRIDILFIK